MSRSKVLSPNNKASSLSAASNACLAPVALSSNVNGDGQERLVRNRLRWLEGNWDGKLTPPRSLSPTPGTRWARSRRRLTHRGHVERAPHWDGQNTSPGTPPFATKNEMLPLAQLAKYTASAADSTAGTSNKEGNSSETSVVPSSCSGADGDGGFVHSTSTRVGVRRVGGKCAPPADHTRNFYCCTSTSTALSPSASRGDCSSVLVKPSKDDESDEPRGWDVKGRANLFSADDGVASSRGGTYSDASGLESPQSVGVNIDGVSVLSSENFAAESLHGEGEESLLGDFLDDLSSDNKAPRADASFSTTSTTAAVVGNDVKANSQQQLQQQQQQRFVDVGNVLHEKTQWQLRALRAENELASLRAQYGGGTESADLAENPASATTTTKLAADKTTSKNRGANDMRAPFSEPASGTSAAAASSVESDSGSQYSDRDCFIPTRLPAARRRGSAPLRSSPTASTSSAQELDGVVKQASGFSRGAGNCRVDEELGGKPWQEQREEIASLKEELRKAEIRQAAVEATAASVLQRARAAELSRDVKEIQIRNLEVRLAKYTNSDKHHQEACAQWRKRNHGGGSPNDTLDSFQRHEPLSAVQEEEPLSPCGENDGGQPPAAASINSSTAPPPRAFTAWASTYPPHEVGPSRARNNGRGGDGDVGAWGRRLRKFEDKFRQGCVVFGARAARASDGAAAAAAATSKAAVGAAKEAAQLATVAEVGVMGENRKDGADLQLKVATSKDNGGSCRQAKTEGGPIDEYWGSDYCTPT